MEEKKRKQLKGVVVGNKMDKTVRVQVETRQIHPRYKKVVTVRKVFFAHTEKEHTVGDEVTIVQSRPYSKKVKWRVE